MFPLLIVVALSLSLPMVQAAGAAPDAATVKAVVARVTDGLKSGNPDLAIDGLRAAHGVSAPEVVAAVARGLKTRDYAVKQATIETLRLLDHPDALVALENFARREKRFLRNDPGLYAQVLRAAAWHGKEGTIDLLVSDIWAFPDYTVIKARVLGLARIRSDKALEELFKLTNKAGRAKVDPFMSELRLALAELTGTDQGESLDLWWRWWNTNRKGFRVPPQRPELPKLLELQWNAYWQVPTPELVALGIVPSPR